jgi:hypothetical protein
MTAVVGTASAAVGFVQLAAQCHKAISAVSLLFEMGSNCPFIPLQASQSKSSTTELASGVKQRINQLQDLYNHHKGLLDQTLLETTIKNLIMSVARFDTFSDLPDRGYRQMQDLENEARNSSSTGVVGLFKGMFKAKELDRKFLELSESIDRAHAQWEVRLGPFIIYIIWLINE